MAQPVVQTTSPHLFKGLDKYKFDICLDGTLSCSHSLSPINNLTLVTIIRI